MPLIKSGSRAAVSKNISEMMAAGHPQKQAIAAAMRNARQYSKKRADGGKVQARLSDSDNYRRLPLSENIQDRRDEDPAPVNDRIEADTARQMAAHRVRMKYFGRGDLPMRKGFAAGGGSQMMPWTERASARALTHAGAIKSPVPGRTDQLPIGVGGGAYVLPADHVAHVGQGNTDAGTNALDKMFSMGKFGAPKSTKPRMPRLGLRRRLFADGGAPDSKPVDIIAAGGEYVIPPEVVQKLGNGDMDTGHKILDKWVLSTRKDHIRTLQNLKPPKKS